MRVSRVENTKASRSSRRAMAWAKIMRSREYRSIDPLTSQMSTSGRRRTRGLRWNRAMSSPLERMAWRAERRRSMRPDRAARSRRVRRSPTRQGACSRRRRTCSVSAHVISSKSLWRSSSSALYPLERAGNSVGFCSRFICEALSPRALAQAFARSGESGSARLRPGMTPAEARGSGGAQKMSKAASKVGRSSLRLTNTDRSAFRKSPCCFRSMTPSARVASVSRRGPASSPASCKRRANAPRRGSRSTPSLGTLRLVDQRPDLLPNALQVFLVLESRAHRRVDEVRVDVRGAQCGQGTRPVERLRDSRHLVQVHSPQSLHERRHFAGQPIRRLRGPSTHDLDLFVEVRIVDPVIEAAALERVVNLACAVGRDHDERHLACLDRGRLGLAHTRLALDEQRLLELEGEKDRGGKRPVADIATFAQAALDVLDGKWSAHGDKAYEETGLM